MSNRTLRVNELLQREVSDILRKRYQSDAVTITITEIRVSPDLRDARVFVSIVGDEETAQKKLQWLRSIGPEIRAEVSRHVVLKYLPKFEYLLDQSAVRGSRILRMLDEIEPAPGEAAEPTEPSDPSQPPEPGEPEAGEPKGDS